MDLFPILLTAALVILAAVFAFSSGTPPAVSDDGNRLVVEFGRPIRAFGGGLSVFVISAGILAARHPEVKQFDAAFFVVLSLVLGIYVGFTVLRTRFEYDSDNLIFTPAFSRPKSISWSDVVDITISSWGGGYVLTLRNGKKIGVAEQMNGSEALMDFARRWKNHNTQ